VAPVSTLWQFGIGFGDVISLANDELNAVFAGTETIDSMLAAIKAGATAALGGS
jgi:hypothetical protein